MVRRLPGGYGQRQGPDAYLGNSESQYLREALIPREDGWIISTVGENFFSHIDVTGVLQTQDTLRLLWLPGCVSTTVVTQVRIGCAAAAVSSSVEVALYQYATNELRMIPGTFMVFDTTGTGLKSRNLPLPVAIPANSRILVAVLARGGAPTLEGYQSGAGVSSRVLRFRAVTGHTAALKSTYKLSDLPLSAAADAALVAYLSQDAANVL